MIINVASIPYCVNCDWLQFSIRLPEPEPELMCPDGFRLELLQGNNIYRYRAMLFDSEGRKWFTMLWGPYSSVLDKRIATVQFANWVLYSDMIQVCFDRLCDVVFVEFNSMGRIDICIDFVAQEFQLECLRHLNSGHYYLQGKREGSAWWHCVNPDRQGFERHLHHCLSWGSKTSEIKVKVYYKSREQGVAADPSAQPDKPWIVDEWRYAGMDISGVWRLEFSLSGASCLRYDGHLISLENVASGEWLVLVMAKLLSSRFVVRKNQGRRNGHHNNDQIVPFLSLPFSGIELRWADRRDRPVVSDAIVMLRRLLGMLDLSPVRCSRPMFDGLAGTIIDLVHSEHLERYFDDKIGGSVEGYLEELSESVGMGCAEVSLSPSAMFS